MRSQFKYTPEQIEFLKKKFKSMMGRELTAAFNKRFGLDKTKTAIHSVLTARKITCGRHGYMPGVRLSFTKAQIRFLKKYYMQYSLSDLTVQLNKKFGIQKSIKQVRGFTRNHRIRSGRTGCFEKGHIPANKGTKGLMHGSCTSFKKGNIPANTKHLGAERKDNRTDPAKTNYIWVKVSERNPYTGAPTRYRQKHVVIWEQEHGPVPEGMSVTFRDGNEDNFSNENLMLVSRAELLRLNKYHYKDLPAEIKPSLLALAKLEVKVFGAQKNVGPAT
jgi:hypothetical protein